MKTIGAVAWMNERNGFICKEKTRDYHVPLFLSPTPTIPEGMVLFGRTLDGIALYSMIAAAQGEK